MFDEQPDGDPHGECAAEIHRLHGLLRDLVDLHDSWLAGRLDSGSVCQGSAWECARAAIAGVTPTVEQRGRENRLVEACERVLGCSPTREAAKDILAHVSGVALPLEGRDG